MSVVGQDSQMSCTSPHLTSPLYLLSRPTVSSLVLLIMLVKYVSLNGFYECTLQLTYYCLFIRIQPSNLINTYY